MSTVLCAAATATPEPASSSTVAAAAPSSTRRRPRRGSAATAWSASPSASSPAVSSSAVAGSSAAAGAASASAGAAALSVVAASASGRPVTSCASCAGSAASSVVGTSGRRKRSKNDTGGGFLCGELGCSLRSATSMQPHRRTFDCNQIVIYQVNRIGRRCDDRHSRATRQTKATYTVGNDFLQRRQCPGQCAGPPRTGTPHRRDQYQPTDWEWPQAPHGVPYRPEMEFRPQVIWVAGLVRQSEPAEAIFDPGSDCGMP